MSAKYFALIYSILISGLILIMSYMCIHLYQTNKVYRRFRPIPKSREAILLAQHPTLRKLSHLL